MDGPTHYEVLGLAKGASTDEIRAAHRRLVHQVHTDKGGSATLFRQVQVAYEVLSDPASYCGIRSAARNGLRRSTAWMAPACPVGDDVTTTGLTQELGESHLRPVVRDPLIHHHHHRRRRRRAQISHGRRLPRQLLRRHQVAASERALLAPFRPRIRCRMPGSCARLEFRAAAPLASRTLGLVAALLGASGLLGHRRAVARDNMRRASIPDIDLMSGTQFELRLVDAFRRAGYLVQHVGGPRDFGSDLIVAKDGVRTVVQAKRQRAKVGQPAVREAATARMHYGADSAVVVTSSYFTETAVMLAASNGVGLWNRDVLATFISAQVQSKAHTGWARGGR